MVNNFETTLLWKRTLGLVESHQVETRKLETSYRSFRHNVAQLIPKIAHAIPNLTDHSIIHLDALWSVADSIIGDTYPMNPLEAFIFGGAILLHDSALCFEAYEGGKAGLRGTVEWKDAFAHESNNDGTNEEKQGRADFSALRLLHAQQAAKLATKPWSDNKGQDIYLIDDQHLREHYGELIGDIASSHHWNIEEVESRFSRIKSPSAGFPSDWTIDPLKIACMLRCADAGHIDGLRAPDFLLALLKRNDISQSHWFAQNHLSQICRNPSDSASLLISSTRSFSKDQSNAWWVAYDAVDLINRELQSCNDTLERANRNSAPSFKAKKVVGAGSISEFRQHVMVDGWIPIASQIHVSNAEDLVSKFGGERLYGSADNLAVVLRELLQNARDGIRAREAVEPGFIGKITVKIDQKRSAKESSCISVEDDGVGMSPRVLTGPLLDFGTSFWATNLVASEFPGLRSSTFQPIGRFGIGFFSIFMIASSATVYSRKYDQSLEECCKLDFAQGLTLRPIFSKERPANFSMSQSTCVNLNLMDGVLDDIKRIQITQNLMGAEDFYVHISDYIGAIVAGLDVPVELIFDGELATTLQQFPPSEADYGKWLDQLSYNNTRNRVDIKAVANGAVKRLRPLLSGQETVGVAALTIHEVVGYDFLSANAVGGLVDPHNRDASCFVGLMNFEPDTVQRQVGHNRAEGEILNQWLEEQIGLLQKCNLSPTQMQLACSSIADLGGDPFPIFNSINLACEKETHVLLAEDFVEYLTKQPLMFLQGPYTGGHIETHHDYKPISGYHVYMPTKNSKFLSAQIDNGTIVNKNSVVGCVDRMLRNKGKTPSWRTEKNITNGKFWQLNGLVVTI